MVIKSTFTTPLEVEYVDGRNWKVTQEFDYILDWENKEDRVIRVPVGFLTDFASIPKILWNLLPPTGTYGKAAVIHDYLYKNGGRVPCPNCVGDVYTRKQCDGIFYDAMGVLGTPEWKRKVMYRAVRMFGGSSFKG